MTRKKDEPRIEKQGGVGENLYHLEVLVKYPIINLVKIKGIALNPLSIESMVLAGNDLGAVIGAKMEIERLYRTNQIDESVARVAYYLRDQDGKLIVKGQYEKNK